MTPGRSATVPARGDVILVPFVLGLKLRLATLLVLACVERENLQEQERMTS